MLKLALRISSLQAFLGHFWRSINRNRKLTPDQENNCKVLVNFRQRLNSPLPQHFLGNKTVALTDEEARKYLRSWVKSPKLRKEGCPASNDVIVVNSPQFNVYGNDLGWAKPITVRGGDCNNVDGKLTLLPGVEEGNVDIKACFFPETLQAMSKDAEFMEAVTI